VSGEAEVLIRNPAHYRIIRHISAKDYPENLSELRGAFLAILLIYLSKNK